MEGVKIVSVLIHTRNTSVQFPSKEGVIGEGFLDSSTQNDFLLLRLRLVYVEKDVLTPMKAKTSLLINGAKNEAAA